MRRRVPSIRLRCPRCGTGLAAIDDDAERDGSIAVWCPGCEATFRARPKPARSAPTTQRPIGHFALFYRTQFLGFLFGVYRLGLGLGTLGLLACGGFVPVLRAWLLDSVSGWNEIVAMLGGVPIRLDSTNPDADFGPKLRRADAPPLFDLIGALARDLNIRPPEEVRLAFLPCCGVVAWKRSRTVLLGLTLLSVLDIAELRAILAHELAHLARGDATWVARLVRSVEILNLGLEAGDTRARGPLRWWAVLCRRWANALLAPIAQGQEVRADRTSAVTSGGQAAASALMKVALIQPLFRELLQVFDQGRPAAQNLYATFRNFWMRLPLPLVEAMRLNLLASNQVVDQSPHPPLADRVAQLLSYPDRPRTTVESQPALSLLGDAEWLEQMLHDRLYKLHSIEPSVFHAAGS